MSLYLGHTKIKQIFAVFNDGVDTDVTESNIRNGVRILGVVGKFTADGTQTPGNDIATSSDIVEGKSAWCDGAEVQGNLIVQHFYTGSDTPDSSIGNNGDIFLKV